MKKRILIWTAVGLALGVGLAFALPVSRYPLLSLLRNERLYNGRPISYWLAALKDDDAKARREAALVLGEAEAGKTLSPDHPECRAVVAALAETLGDRDGLVRK